MSRGEWRETECGKKQAYTSWAEANRVLRAMLRRGQRALGMYRCRWCRGWHIGHQVLRDKGVRRDERARNRRAMD